MWFGIYLMVIFVPQRWVILLQNLKKLWYWWYHVMVLVVPRYGTDSTITLTF